ncbi:aliphatic sulfonates import ATP-binding protein SsuB [Alicyclobacillus contaminans]|uniref:ABC transporter ATP-binding protein n=1 Tax=Alicyclobacillus contaminans TaxID=392016 RepID=UPI000416151C|nr:ABC transporter ATP-binding protein [Alicyclobacillus contaminans]GMA51630.1 aliphatic sulfonates import ATP-binding protein SsuB [Alicyclobacillus contaminans]
MSDRQELVIRGLHKSFDTAQGPLQVLRDIHLQVPQGEFVAIIGPSGCGKSTLLRVIAGLDPDYDGDVTLDGERVQQPGVDKGFVFQEHRLFPWLTVAENIAANLSLKDRATREKVKQLIHLVHLDGFEQAYPRQLSGGMAQRVAIARALLRDPKVLLMDEPFGALDAFTRAHMQDVMLNVWLQNRTTVILVTHDIDEAIVLAQRVVVMRAKPGSVQTIVPVNLPYPRKRSDTRLLELRREVLRQLESHMVEYTPVSVPRDTERRRSY